MIKESKARLDILVALNVVIVGFIALVLIR